LLTTPVTPLYVSTVSDNEVTTDIGYTYVCETMRYVYIKPLSGVV